MIEIALVAANATVFGLCVLNYFMSCKQEKRVNDLLNRIMARDYEQYANVNIKMAQAQAPMEVISAEDLEQRITEQTQGIPV